MFNEKLANRMLAAAARPSNRNGQTSGRVKREWTVDDESEARQARARSRMFAANQPISGVGAKISGARDNGKASQVASTRVQNDFRERKLGRDAA